MRERESLFTLDFLFIYSQWRFLLSHPQLVMLMVENPAQCLEGVTPLLSPPLVVLPSLPKLPLLSSPQNL